MVLLTWLLFILFELWFSFFSFFSPSKSGIDIGTRREWIAHLYSHSWYTVSERVSGTSGFHWNLEKEWTWMVMKTPKPREDGEDPPRAPFEDLSSFAASLQVIPFWNCPVPPRSGGGLSTDNVPVCLIPEMPPVKASSGFTMTGGHRPQRSSTFHAPRSTGLFSLLKKYDSSRQMTPLCWLGCTVSVFYLVRMLIPCSAATRRQGGGNLDTRKAREMASRQKWKMG